MNGQKTPRPGSSRPDLDPENVTPSQTEVLTVDRHPVIREAIGVAINNKAELRLIGESETAEDALEQISRHPPDVVVTGLLLADAHGLDLVEEIRSRYPDVRMLVFSTFEESLCAEQALRAGALGYVMKSQPTETVITAIEAVQSGNVYLGRKMSSQIISNVIKRKNDGYSPATERFTDRERTVFEKLGEGNSVREIAEELDLNRKTVETYRRRARKKLGLESVKELIRYAIQWNQRRELKSA